MDVNPFWYLCITVRFTLIFFIRWLYNTIKDKKMIRIILGTFLLIIGAGFLYKSIIGSNNEIQIAKVFWHETRAVHSVLYLLSGFYLLKDNLNMCSLLLFTDLMFSFFYRFILNK